MVSTVRPKASETPAKPMPSSGKPAARTALPQPPKTSQKVPKASAASLLIIGVSSSSDRSNRSAGMTRPDAPASCLEATDSGQQGRASNREHNNSQLDFLLIP